MLTCQHIARRIVNSCTRNYIPACQVLYLDRRFLYRNGNTSFCPSPCLTCEEGLPLLRIWGHGRSRDRRAGGQEDGTREAPCPIFAACIILPTCTTCPSVNAGICTFSAFTREALRRKGLRDFLPCWTSHGRRGIVAGAGAGAGARAGGR